MWMGIFNPGRTAGLSDGRYRTYKAATIIQFIRGSYYIQLFTINWDELAIPSRGLM
jgi:hypothetical protein